MFSLALAAVLNYVDAAVYYEKTLIFELFMFGKDTVFSLFYEISSKCEELLLDFLF